MPLFTDFMQGGVWHFKQFKIVEFEHGVICCNNMCFPIYDVDLESEIHIRYNDHDGNSIRIIQDATILIIGDPVDTTRMKNVKNYELKQIHQETMRRH